MKQKPHLTVTWYGHSAMLLESLSGRKVLIDPWLENPKAPAGAKDTVSPDIILVTHGHSDHLGNTVELAKRTNAKVVAIFEVSLWLQSKGVATAVGMNKGGTMTIDGIKITMVDAKHSSGIDDGNTVVAGGEAAGYVVEFEHGFKVYHAGDTCVFGDMRIIADLYRPHLAFLPIGGLYSMDPHDASYAVKLMAAGSRLKSPQYIIGMHYGTFPALAGTPAQLRKELPAALKKRVIELEVGTPRTL